MAALLFRPVFWLLRWACVLALLCLAVAALRAVCAPLGGQGGWEALVRSAALWTALGGLALRVLLTRWRRSDPLEFVDTLEHELTHALAGTLTFAPPVSLTATLRGGGEVELKRSNPVAALAPYCLPLYAALTALLTLILRTGWVHYGQLTAAFLLGSFAYRFLREFHFGQTDFRAYGFVFSMVFVAAALPLCLLLVLETARLLQVPWRWQAWPLWRDQALWVWHGIRAHIGPRPAGTI